MLSSVSPPKMPSREKPASSGFVASAAPAPARRAGGVERSTLITSGMKMPEMSVRPVVTASGGVLLNTRALIRAASSGVSAYFRKVALSISGVLRL